MPGPGRRGPEEAGSVQVRQPLLYPKVGRTSPEKAKGLWANGQGQRPSPWSELYGRCGQWMG